MWKQGDATPGSVMNPFTDGLTAEGESVQDIEQEGVQEVEHSGRPGDFSMPLDIGVLKRSFESSHAWATRELESWITQLAEGPTDPDAIRHAGLGAYYAIRVMRQLEEARDQAAASAGMHAGRGAGLVPPGDSEWDDLGNEPT